jgi:putative transposase
MTDGLDGFLVGCRYLIHDRASQFTSELAMILKSVGIKSLRLPARSPNLNAFAERYVRTLKEGCLDRMILIGEGSLHRAISEFVAHYHPERNHQSLENKIIRPEFAAFPSADEVHCRARLGGMLRYYYRQAA